MDDEDLDISLLRFVKILVEESTRKVADKFIDDLVFPWYEARTGRHSSKSMRQQVSDKIEQALSRTLWITKRDGLEISSDGTDDDFIIPPKFIVGRVFPQAGGSGRYTLKVVIFQRGLPVNTHELSLEEFMRDFVPHEEVGFEDFSA